MNALLRKRARDLGLCDKWYKEWDKNETRQELINKYLKGIDFCIEHDYPSVEFIRHNFPKAQLQKNGVFLDDNVEKSNLSNIVLLSDTKAVLNYDGMSVGNVYVRHRAYVDITSSGDARVFVETYENCNVKANAQENSKIFIYTHGGSVSSSGNVIVRDKRKNEG